MLTNTDAKRIVFYGDSLVWGKVPGENKQFPSDVRFTGVLQRLLGNDCDVIEAGLRARNLAGENPYFKDRDGLVTFSPIIGSLMPADVIVLFLGSNDTNNKPDFNPETIARSLSDYKNIVTEWAAFLECPLPKLAVVIPPRIHEAGFDELIGKLFAGAGAKIELLRKAIEQEALALELPIFDAGIVEPDEADGIHLSAESNALLGEALVPFVHSLL